MAPADPRPAISGKVALTQRPRLPTSVCLSVCPSSSLRAEVRSRPRTTWNVTTRHTHPADHTPTAARTCAQGSPESPPSIADTSQPPRIVTVRAVRPGCQRETLVSGHVDSAIRISPSDVKTTAQALIQIHKPGHQPPPRLNQSPSIPEHRAQRQSTGWTRPVHPLKLPHTVCLHYTTPHPDLPIHTRSGTCHRDNGR